MDPKDTAFTDPRKVYLVGLSKALLTQRLIDSASTWHSMTKFNIGTPKAGSPLFKPSITRVAPNTDLHAFGRICQLLYSKFNRLHSEIQANTGAQAQTVRIDDMFRDQPSIKLVGDLDNSPRPYIPKNTNLDERCTAELNKIIG